MYWRDDKCDVKSRRSCYTAADKRRSLSVTQSHNPRSTILSSVMPRSRRGQIQHRLFCAKNSRLIDRDFQTYMIILAFACYSMSLLACETLSSGLLSYEENLQITFEENHKVNVKATAEAITQRIKVKAKGGSLCPLIFFLTACKMLLQSKGSDKNTTLEYGIRTV